MATTTTKIWISKLHPWIFCSLWLTQESVCLKSSPGDPNAQSGWGIIDVPRNFTRELLELHFKKKKRCQQRELKMSNAAREAISAQVLQVPRKKALLWMPPDPCRPHSHPPHQMPLKHLPQDSFTKNWCSYTSPHPIPGLPRSPSTKVWKAYVPLSPQIWAFSFSV